MGDWRGHPFRPADEFEAACSSARHVEKFALGMKYRANSDAEVREADDVLRLAVGLRRVLERVTAARKANGNPAVPAAHEEE